MKTRLWILVAALLAVFAACSDTPPETTRIVETIGECVGGSAGEGGAPEGGAGGESGAGEMGGEAGVAGAGGEAGGGPLCTIDDPVALAAAAGINLRIYVNADDPNLTIDSGVQTWPDRSGNGFHFIQHTTAWRPTLNVLDTTLDGHASIQGDGVNDRMIEVAWGGPGRPGDPPSATSGPWGQMHVTYYVNWVRAKQSGISSQTLPTRGSHSGEPVNFPGAAAGWRLENGGGTPILIPTVEERWDRVISQYRNCANANTGANGCDWACVNGTCVNNRGSGMGNATHSVSGIFGCTNAIWDPGGDVGNCFAEVKHAVVIRWQGYLAQDDYDIFDEWLECWYGGAVAID